MRLLFIIYFISCLSFNGLGQNVRFLTDDYEAAFLKAKEENKLVFIDTWATWCKPCKKQEPVFWDRSLAQFFNEHFVSVKVNVDSRFGKSLALKYSIVFLPTLMILDDHGNVRYRSDRSSSADLITVDELLSIAVEEVFPQRRLVSANSHTQDSPPVETPLSITPKKPKPVQHTELPKENQANVTAANTTVQASKQNTPASYSTKATDITSQAGEKILYVLGEGEDLPPEVLREEAYFRLSLMDGSHRDAVKKYLSTHQDWAQDENMKFLFDFLYTTRSDEFAYLIYNRHKFEKLLGKDRVANSINILTNQTLQRAYPRPDLKEAQALYSYVNPSTSKKKGTKYSLLKLYDEKEIDKFILRAKDYLAEIDPSDVDIMILQANSISENVQDKKSLKYAMKLIDNSIKIRGPRFEYLDIKAFLSYKLGDKRKAVETARIAISLAKSRGINHDSTLQLVKLIESL